MPRYPRTITSGGGEEITFLEHVRTGSQDRLVLENSVSPGAGPPMHVHWLQEEALTVLSGRMGHQVAGGGERFAGAGETVAFPAGVPHRFWNAGAEQLRCRGWVSPALNVEFFLTALYDSTRENGGRGPHRHDAAFLLTRYRSEFGLLVVPPLVQKLVFPIHVWLGRMSGRLRKYADAPEPARG